MAAGVRSNLFWAVFAGGLFGCGTGTNTGQAAQKHAVSGWIEKGPFDIGSNVSLHELDPSLTPTGRSFDVQTTDDLGSFSVSATLATARADLVASGFFFDEIDGAPTAAQLTLRALADVAAPHCSVNALTTLARARTLHLVQGGATLAVAEGRARGEVLAAFGIATPTQRPFQSIRSSDGDDDGAVLLAVSSVLLQAAHTRGTDTSSMVSQLSSLLAQLGSDLEPDGVVDDAGLKDELRAAGIAAPLSTVRTNLEARFAASGSPVKLADFEGFVDSDGDGLLNRYDYPLDFPPVTTTKLATPVTSEPRIVRLFTASPATASVSVGTLVLDGVDTGSAEAQVVDGDSVAIRLVSAPAFDQMSVTQTATIAIGLNRGTFSLTTAYPQPVWAAPFEVDYPLLALARSADPAKVFAGTLADAASRRDTFVVLDVSTPTSPQKVAGVQAGDVLRIATSECGLAVAVGSATVGLIDVADVAHPRLAGTIQGSDGVLAPDCRTAYTVTGRDVFTYDITDRANPALVSTTAVPDRCLCGNSCIEHLALSPDGKSLYALASMSGVSFAELNVLDVTSPAAVAAIGQWAPCAGRPVGMRVSGDGRTGYVFGEALSVVDLSSPSAPTLLASFDRNGTLDLLPGGTVAYLAGSVPGELPQVAEVFLSVVGLADLTDPVELAYLVGPGGNWATPSALAVTSDGSFAYVGVTNGYALPLRTAQLSP